MANQRSDFYSQGPGRKRGHDGGPSEGYEDFKRKKVMPAEDFSDDPDEPPATLRILVRHQAAGGIIGKGGDNIKRLRKQYDCQVTLPDSPGASERVMTIMGGIGGCIGVLADVLPQLAEGSSRDVEVDRTMLEVQVLIPQPFMGTIIGTGGTKIKDLRLRTHANIKIFSDPMPCSNERSIQLMGTRDQIVDCAQYFMDEISKKEPREPIYLYVPGQQYSDAGDDGFSSFPPRGGGRGGPRFRGRGGPGRGGGFHGDASANQWSSPRGGRGGGGMARGSRGGRGRGGGGMNPGGRSMADSGWAPPPPVPQPGSFGSQPPPSQQAPVPFPTALPPQAPHVTPTRPPPSNYPPPVAGGNVGYGSAPPTVGYNVSQANTAPPPASQPPRAGVPSQGYAAGPPAMNQAPPPGPAQYGGPPPQQPPAPQTVGHAPQQQTTTQQVTIPNQYAEAIVGVSGGNLQQIKAQSSCDITVEDARPGSGERIITIVGTPNGIQFAQQLMQNSVRQHHNV